MTDITICIIARRYWPCSRTDWYDR